MLDIAPAPEDEPSGLMESLVDDLSMRDAERLQKLFPGVPFRNAAVALLRDALDQAEAMEDATP